MLISRNDQPPVELLTIDQRRCDLVKYRCTTEEAERFAATFREALDRIPQTAVDVLKAHWTRGNGPRVTLPRSTRAWGGRGWAASLPGGLYFMFVAQIVVAIPPEYLQTFVAHECGHALCCMVAEPAHIGRDRVRQEWLIWHLMQAWGFDQPAAELWGYQHVDVDGEEPRICDVPLDEEEMRQKRDVQRQRLMDKLGDTSIPAELRSWLRE